MWRRNRDCSRMTVKREVNPKVRFADYQPGDEPIPEFLVLGIVRQLPVCSVVKEGPKPVG